MSAAGHRKFISRNKGATFGRHLAESADFVQTHVPSHFLCFNVLIGLGLIWRKVRIGPNI
jgi:hypothetical protein